VFKPYSYTLLYYAKARIAVKEDRADQGFCCICKDLFFPILPESLFAASQPDKFFDPQAPAYLCERDVIFKLLFFLCDLPFCPDPFFHEEQD
jgi:hypothetical protein